MLYIQVSNLYCIVILIVPSFPSRGVSLVHFVSDRVFPSYWARFGRPGRVMIVTSFTLVLFSILGVWLLGLQEQKVGGLVTARLYCSRISMICRLLHAHITTYYHASAQPWGGWRMEENLGLGLGPLSYDGIITVLWLWCCNMIVRDDRPIGCEDRVNEYMVILPYYRGGMKQQRV